VIKNCPDIKNFERKKNHTLPAQIGLYLLDKSVAIWAWVATDAMVVAHFQGQVYFHRCHIFAKLIRPGNQSGIIRN
jgi:hypothetical protein